MKDEEIWHSTAIRLLDAVSRIERGEPFESFHPIKLFNLYLAASYLYYRRDVSVMRDTSYDQLCGYLLDNYEAVQEVIRHKELLNKERLQAGTGFDLTYPPAIVCIVQHYERILYRRNKG